MAFYRKLLVAASNIRLKRSSANPCQYYEWEGGRIVIMISWINDNMIVGPTDLILKLKNDLMTQFECDDCRALTEYIENKIEYVGEGAIRMVQTVLTQSYKDEFKLGKRCYNTPATLGIMLMCPAEGDNILNPVDQTTLRSGVGKLMYQMQYLKPDIAQAVQDLARYMTRGDVKILEAMRRCMIYVLCTRDEGLLLKPTQKWDGSNKHEFCLKGTPDLDYAKNTQTRQSVSGYVVYLEGVPTMHRSAMQKAVALSSCKAELNVAVLCVQDMMYQKNMLD
jgi:hypothetical protein